MNVSPRFSPVGRRLLPGEGWRLLRLVGLSLLAVLGLVVVLGATLSTRWQAREAILIAAPPTHLHRIVSDLSTWPDWALPEGKALKLELRGEAGREGQALLWSQEAEVAAARGSIRLTRTQPGRGTWFETQAASGRRGSGSLTYQPRAGLTQLTWDDSGSLPPIIGGLFRDLYQKQLSAHMRRGLERLKRLAERGPAPPSSATPN